MNAFPISPLWLVAASIVLAALIILSSSLRRMFTAQPMWRPFLAPDRRGWADDEEYFVEHYSEDAATVSIALDGTPVFRKEFSRPFLAEDAKTGQALRMLEELGVDYVDVGYHADWVAAEIPGFTISLLRIPADDYFKKVAKLLQDLRELTLPQPGSPVEGDQTR